MVKGAPYDAPISLDLVKKHSSSTTRYSTIFILEYLILKIEHLTTSPDTGGVMITEWLYTYQALGGY
jgi:hypothetical protein